MLSIKNSVSCDLEGDMLDGQLGGFSSRLGDNFSIEIQSGSEQGSYVRCIDVFKAHTFL